jgi:NADPH-dependent glutamate synthase beta subunit-like oxidoreductase
LAIGALARAASEHGAAAREPVRAGVATGKRVAIIGAGSAASAAAYRLRQIGHAVTLFDQLPIGGGMTAVGYPDFRLPLEVVQRENALAEWGVELRFNVAVDAALVQHLLDTFDAVIAGTGKFKSQRLGIPGEDLAGVWDALDFLTRVKLGRDVPIGRAVVVLGAGYSAQDSSRAARRLGSAVAIHYRRRAEDMPVNQEQRQRYVARQAAEGAPYLFQRAALRIIGENGRVAGVEFVRTEPGAPDASGRPDGVAVAGTEFIVACDTVIAAVGEAPDLSYLPGNIRATAAGHVWVEPETFATSIPRLYAAGEMIGARGTDNAFKTGFLCAASVDRALNRPSPAQRERDA